MIPNSNILNSEVVNYSALASQSGLILHTTVGIGYETPWRQVEAMLLEAAARTPGLLREPPAFVLQKLLGDFAVDYELNAYCDDARDVLVLYTDAAPQHPRRLQRVWRADHDARLRRRYRAAQGGGAGELASGSRRGFGRGGWQGGACERGAVGAGFDGRFARAVNGPGALTFQPIRSRPCTLVHVSLRARPPYLFRLRRVAARRLPWNGPSGKDPKHERDAL